MSKPVKMRLYTWIVTTDHEWAWMLQGNTWTASSQHRGANWYKTQALAIRAARRFARNNGIEIEE